MLTYMIIRNFAIIDALEVEFSGGFTVITGETGAGKSILINALNLLLGGRANTDIVRHDTERALVEGTFALSEDRRVLVDPILEEAGIETGDELIIRREVKLGSGRSRAFINGSVSTLSTLREVTRGLVDISGQHEHYSLLQPEVHVTILDHFGGLDRQARRVMEDIERFSELRREVARLKRTERERLARMDYLKFQIDEINDAIIDPEEHAALEREARMLRNAAKLREETYAISQQLYEGDPAIVDLLGDMCSTLERLARFDERLGAMVEVFDQARIQLGEAALEIRDYQKQVVTDPKRLEEVDERLYAYGQLTGKYGEAYEEIEAQLEASRAELKALKGAAGRIDEASVELDALRARVMSEARNLSEARRAAATRLTTLIEHELTFLGMGRCKFAVAMDYRDEQGQPTTDINLTTPASLNERGIDVVEFLIAPNPGEGFKPMARIASGGELSRIMLAIKSSLMATDPVPTYVFDEVDTGIGGGVAVAVGEKIREVARNKQVVSITHLPQIAAFANQHFKVAKLQREDHTTSTLTPLKEKERVLEIARMLGGVDPTPTTLEHAAEMIARSHK